MLYLLKIFFRGSNFDVGIGMDAQQAGFESTKAIMSEENQEFVRKPDVSVVTKLVSDETTTTHVNVNVKKREVSSVFAASASSYKPKTAKEVTLANLFQRPTSIIFNGSFYEVSLSYLNRILYKFIYIKGGPPYGLLIFTIFKMFYFIELNNT